LGARAGRDRYEEIRQLASLAAERLESYGSSGSLASRVSQTPSRGDGDVSGA
jgi:hypothetical protein